MASETARRTARWLLFSALTLSLAAAPPPADSQPALSAAERAAAIDAIAEVMTASYVDEAVARRASAALRELLGKGMLDDYRDADIFAARLTRELRRVAGDRHLEVRVKAPPETAPAPAGEDWKDDLRRRGYDFRSVQRLSGGVTYIDLRSFPPVEVARDSAAAAMALLANGDAAVIDLRRNSGGTGEMVELLSGYFLPPGTLLSTAYKRLRNEAREARTPSDVPPTRLRELPLYLLTSGATFSAAESFAYELQARHRAIVVGEPTRGGANPGGYEAIGQRFLLFVPDVRVVSAVTGGNWEGVGVRPELPVPAADALTAAHRAALRHLHELAVSSVRRRELAWALEALAAAEREPAASPADLEPYRGSYGERDVAPYQGELGVRRAGGLWSRLLPVATDTFLVEGADGVRLQFERDRHRRVTTLRLLYADGEEERLERETAPPR